MLRRPRQRASKHAILLTTTWRTLRGRPGRPGRRLRRRGRSVWPYRSAPCRQPASAKPVTRPAASHSRVSRQRTRPVTCSTSSRRISSGLCTGRAVMLALNGARKQDGRLRQGFRHLVGGRLHQRAVKQRRDVQQDRPRLGLLGLLDGHGPRPPYRRRSPHCRCCCRCAPQAASSSTRRSGVFGQGHVGFGSNQRSHRPSAHRNRPLHRLTAQFQEPGGVARPDLRRLPGPNIHRGCDPPRRPRDRWRRRIPAPGCGSPPS